MPEIPGPDSWLVVRTHTNRERYAADNIAQLGATPYLPEVIETVRKVVRGVRKRTFQRRPLFPGYLFVRYLGQWRFLQSTYGVLGVIPGTDGPGLIDGSVIARIRAREGVNGAIDLPPARFQPGQRVRVSSGMFSGFYGEYVGLFREASAAERVKALLDYMGRKVPFLLEEDVVLEAA